MASIQLFFPHFGKLEKKPQVISFIHKQIQSRMNGFVTSQINKVNGLDCNSPGWGLLATVENENGDFSSPFFVGKKRKLSKHSHFWRQRIELNNFFKVTYSVFQKRSSCWMRMMVLISPLRPMDFLRHFLQIKSIVPKFALYLSHLSLHQWSLKMVIFIPNYILKNYKDSSADNYNLFSFFRIKKIDLELSWLRSY